ncbi:hypothetical protein [Methanosphaera sp. WGK6]|uniref:hypothetical protein n=1 Tax=Methanosphaera sp. WGK6 TaxID=1561964 RepID=UPI0009FC9FFB|nr:hypothetical protein [Methanosphaera sp. WGK6]
MLIIFNKNKPNITKSIILGIVLIILGVIILVTNHIDSFVTSLLWPLLEGSSEGKTVLFLGLMGSLLIFSSIINQNIVLKEKIYENETSHLKYLRIVLIMLVICAIFGVFIEFIIRQQFGVSFFTILTAMDPNTSTTSPMHSHVYKSILGYVSYYFVPSHVNTGSSILKYALPYAYIIIPVWICSYILSIIAIANMKIIPRSISIVTISMILIGILDGGLFSQPFLIGLFILLIIYFAKGHLEYKSFINPVVIMGYILLIAVIIEVGGTDTSCHTLTVINQTEPVDMSEYNVTNINVNGDTTTYTLNCNTPDKELIKNVFSSFEGKSDVTFMSWNFYSYLDNPTMRMRQNK